MKDYLIIYHKNCPDGFASAWIAWKKLKQEENNNVQFYAEQPEPRALPKMNINNKNIIVFDLAYNPTLIKEFQQKAKSYKQYDHHESNYKRYYNQVKNDGCCVFDLGHAACYMAWKLFYPEKKVPVIINYIEDYDLHGLTEFLVYSESHSIYLVLNVVYQKKHYDENFEKWDELLSSKYVGKLLKMGNIFKKYSNFLMNKDIDDINDKLIIKNSAQYNYIVSNCNPTDSDIANKFAERNNIDFCILWTYSQKYQNIGCQIRSRLMNITFIAEHFKGGGHPKAAYFISSLWITDILKQVHDLLLKKSDYERKAGRVYRIKRKKSSKKKSIKKKSSKSSKSSKKKSSKK